MRLVLALSLTAAGCGRVNFDDTRAGDASTLLTCPVSPTAPPMVTITGKTFHYTSFDNTWVPVLNASVRALTGVNGSALAQVTSDGTGAYSISIATGGKPTPVVLELSKGDLYFTSFEILDRPLDRDLAAPAMTMNDVFSPADAPVWDMGAIQQIYDQVLLTRDTTKGSLNIAVRDCADQPVSGVTVELDPPSELLRYQAPDGTASPDLTSTGPPYDHALAFNTPAGPTRIVARKDGVIVADQSVDVIGGTNYTLAIVRAPGP